MQNVEIRKFKKVLVANRGEIAIRVYRALNELGIQTVGIFSKEDKYALFRTKTDEAYMLNPEKGPLDAYLDINNIIKIAKAKGVDAIHPGYGFLSENPEFVEACEKEGIAFIGPNVDVMYKMGDKISSKKMAIECNVPIIPGVDHAVRSLDEVMEVARKVGYPVMLKASNGGGGRGMRIVNSAEEMPKEFEEARNEAKKAFGDDKIFVEKYLRDPKHIEVQVLGDHFGNVIHLGERDCSLQRKNQKVLEEAPSPVLSEETREKMCKSAVLAAKAAGYESAGTIEFLYDHSGQYYFMEMNTRIQVEHPITEMITGVDIVKEQIRVAAGEKLSYEQSDIHITGHAIECRINAENPDRGFAPCPGLVDYLMLPSGGLGIRVDTAIYEGYEIPPFYDSMIAKVIAHGRDREEAIAKMNRALYEFIINGIDTNIEFQSRILNNPDYLAGQFDTSFLEDNLLQQ